MKTCAECNKPKPLDQFHLKRGKPQARFKECRKKYMAELYKKNVDIERQKRKAYYERNKVEILANMKKTRLENAAEINLNRRLKKYGLTAEQYTELWNAQQNRCANPDCISGNADMAIDHDHVTGVVRGILCDNCNTALGLLKEHIPAINGLVSYLSRNIRSKG